eukprot:CAMPEP_0183347510 /NCGR_PEP_ID=MMETSP0164_2-20130417/12309_1 /TAXON_ID=221442 /ORGANISM="Coccolithus pelagicus ssp braarudi, Strain PLY182g" /LENGTH=133 /DNA_ID=CAMNT_0025518945 /DNA_START=147 /DNA_END=548 /DNA_ORIENTATION=-
MSTLQNIVYGLAQLATNCLLPFAASVVASASTKSSTLLFVDRTSATAVAFTTAATSPAAAYASVAAAESGLSLTPSVLCQVKVPDWDVSPGIMAWKQHALWIITWVLLAAEASSTGFVHRHLHLGGLEYLKEF